LSRAQRIAPRRLQCATERRAFSSTIATTGTPKISAMICRHPADFAPPPVSRISFDSADAASRRRP